MSLCVLDASLAVELTLPSQRDAGLLAVKAALRQQGATVPGIWHWEITNVLLRQERQKSAGPLATELALADLARMPLVTWDEGAAASVARLLDPARLLRLTLFDAAYLDLAERTGLPLATLDGGLAAAASRRGVVLLPLTP